MKLADVQLRNETPSDYGTVENLTREAFWNNFAPGCSEPYLLHVVRGSASFIPELDFVAEVDGRVVGHIAYSKARILGDDGASYDVITFGPISVLPEFQGRGIGGRLIEHTKKLAKEMGFRGILIYGDPAYYSRFGFVPAEAYGIGTPGNMYAMALQALELYSGALSGCSGRFHEDPVFDIDLNAAEEYDKRFPPKEKQSGLPSQARFQQVAGTRKPRPATHANSQGDTRAP